MKVIMIDSEAFGLLMDKIIRIEKLMEIKQMQETVEPITWVDTDEVCKILNISSRTAQRYRSNGTIAYSLIGKKIFYARSEIMRLLSQKNTKRETDY